MAGKLLLLPIMIMIITLGGCSSMKLDDYKDTTPQADIKTYFTGPIKAWGIIQDRSGKVVSRFDVDMIGTWKDNIGTLKEDFHYYDGSKNQRIWTITKLGDNKYEGTAGDIIGKATGAQNGSAVQWKYQMDVPVGDSKYRLTFDDWMWQMNDGIVINRSYLKKFGFVVAELTLVIQKQPDSTVKSDQKIDK